MRKTVFIHFVGKLLNEEYGEEAGRQRLFELFHNGYKLVRSVFSEDDNCLYITLERGVNV